MDEEKITIIGGHKFFVRGDGSSGIVPNDEYAEKMKIASDLGTQMHDKIAVELGTKMHGVICTETKLTDEESAEIIDKYSAQMRFYGLANEISRLEDDLKAVKKQAEDLGKKIGEALEGLNEIN